MAFDPELANVLQTVVIAGAGLGAVCAVAARGYQIVRSNNETRAQKLRALKELMGHDGVQQYLGMRNELTNRIVNMKEGIPNARHIDSILRSTLGRFDPKTYL